jgi:predicted transcriptional regulator
MAGVLEQILGLATIEQIEAEQATHRAAIAESQKQLDALDQVRKILVVARDGKAPRKTPKTRRVPNESHSEAGSDQREDAESKPLTANQQAVITAIQSRGPMTVGEISHAIKIQYATAYGAIQKLIEARLIVKSGDKLSLKV